MFQLPGLTESPEPTGLESCRSTSTRSDRRTRLEFWLSGCPSRWRSQASRGFQRPVQFPEAGHAPRNETTLVDPVTTSRLPDAASVGKSVMAWPSDAENTGFTLPSRYPRSDPFLFMTHTTPPAMIGGPGLPFTDHSIPMPGRPPFLLGPTRIARRLPKQENTTVEPSTASPPKPPSHTVADATCPPVPPRLWSCRT